MDTIPATPETKAFSSAAYILWEKEHLPLLRAFMPHNTPVRQQALALYIGGPGGSGSGDDWHRYNEGARIMGLPEADSAGAFDHLYGEGLRRYHLSTYTHFRVPNIPDTMKAALAFNESIHAAPMTQERFADYQRFVTSVKIRHPRVEAVASMADFNDAVAEGAGARYRLFLHKLAHSGDKALPYTASFRQWLVSEGADLLAGSHEHCVRTAEKLGIEAPDPEAFSSIIEEAHARGRDREVF